MCFCLLRISDRKDSPIRSSSQKKPYSRRQRVQQHIRPQQECVLLQFLFEEQAKYRQEIEEQQVESNQLKEHIQQLRALRGKIYDGLDWFASGFGAIQNRFGEFHQDRPGDVLRYKGL
jgi:predicted nuclease with TOPRIM domain